VEKKEYFAGESIRGRLKLSVGPPITLKKGVFIRFRGKESVDLGSDGKELFGEAVVVNKAYTLLENKVGRNTDTQIAAGRYSWKFSVSLKDKIPTSFVEYFGYIRYLLYAVVDDGKYYFYSLPIKVLSPLRIPPHLAQQHDKSVQKQSESHHVLLKATVKSWLYYFGEDSVINLHIEVINQSTHNLASCKVKFIEKRSVFGSTSSTHPFVDTKIIASRNLGDVAAAKTGRFQKDFVISFPPNYKQLTISKENGATLIFVQQYIIISTSKSAVAHKHRQKIEFPITFTMRTPNDATPNILFEKPRLEKKRTNSA